MATIFEPTFSWITLTNTAVFMERTTYNMFRFEHLGAALHFAQWLKYLGLNPNPETHSVWCQGNTKDGMFAPYNRVLEGRIDVEIADAYSNYCMSYGEEEVSARGTKRKLESSK